MERTTVFRGTMTLILSSSPTIDQRNGDYRDELPRRYHVVRTKYSNEPCIYVARVLKIIRYQRSPVEAKKKWIRWGNISWNILNPTVGGAVRSKRINIEFLRDYALFTKPRDAVISWIYCNFASRGGRQTGMLPTSALSCCIHVERRDSFLGTTLSCYLRYHNFSVAVINGRCRAFSFYAERGASRVSCLSIGSLNREIFEFASLPDFWELIRESE